MFNFLRRKKKCLNCGKTFYKAKVTNDQFEQTYKISPCCNSEYEMIK
jgi:hypothetical protein